MRPQMDFSKWREMRYSPSAHRVIPFPSVGCVVSAYLDPSVKVLREDMYARRNVSDLRRVIAWANDMWTISRRSSPGVPAGTVVPDRSVIDKLSVTVLTAGLVRAYFLARQGGTALDVATRTAENRSINSTLGHARDVFSRRSRAYKLSFFNLPDLLGFLHEPMLPEAESEPEPLTTEQWDAMLVAERSLGSSEISIVNRVFRTTGMRSKELCNLHSSWIVRDGPLWCVEIRDRPELGFNQKGVRPRKIPLRADIASELLSRSSAGYLINPGRPKTARENVVNKEHNAWLKKLIGGSGERVQGNHRLRDTVCSALWSLYGPAAAQEAAGHVDPKTTAKHYSRRLLHVAECIRTEISAWGPFRSAIVSQLQ